MADLEDTHNKSHIDFLQKENDRLKTVNKNLKDLLEQVYEMSCLDDIISSGCLERDDDEMLLCNLSLKAEIMEVLHGKSPFPKVVSKLMSTGSILSEVVKLTKHNCSKVLADHYSKEDK